MRHRVSGRLFGRTANQRKALLRGLMASLFEYQRIETTLAKAKEVKKLAERVITLGIKGDLNSKRVALARVPNRAAIAKLFNEIAPRFSGRNGGYLRLVHTRNRVNDAAPMAVLEFVDYEEIREKKEEPKKAEAKEQKAAQKEQKAAQKEKKVKEQKPAKKKKEEKKEGE
jgi:large subunit ribosomal protein L17